MRARRAGRGAGVIAALLLCALAIPATSPAQSLEYPVKAAYLSKFAPFVQWPDAVFGSPSAPFVICIVGEDPFGAAIDQAAAGQRLDQHQMVVKRLARIDHGAGCHVAYIGARGRAAGEALAALKGTPVLTVTDAAGGSAPRGVVNFVVRENRVRFEIDEQAASDCGLGLSAKLLSLAVQVRPRREASR